MKAAVFLLVLANLLLFAFGQGYVVQGEHPEAARLARQVNPGQLQVVARGDPPPAPVAAAETMPAPVGEEREPETAASTTTSTASSTAAASTTTTTVSLATAPAKPDSGKTACVLWRNPAGEDGEKLGKLLAGNFKDLASQRRNVPLDGGTWWVFIPPLPDRAMAEKKAGELKRLGVSDYFIVQENGPNRWAVSLGIFSAESGANSRLAELKDKGVRSARVAPRQREVPAIEVRGTEERLRALRAASPGGQDCP